MGRPESWTKDKREQATQHILQHLEDGKSLRFILNENRDKELLPSRRVFNKWLSEDEKLSTQYARAKEAYADKVFEDIVLIADGTGDDILTDEDGVEQINHNIIQRDRLRIDARKWHLSKLFPKKYGEKLETENTHSGEIRIIRQIKE
jgi:hypothetical protein